MDVETQKQRRLELYPVDHKTGLKAFPLKRKRVLIGKSQACDVQILDSSISSIHAVVELLDSHSVKVYDMNSESGTFIDGKKIVAEKLNLGQKVKFGDLDFEIRHFQKSDVLPPPLEILEKISDLPPRESKLPPRPPSDVESKTPKKSPVKKQDQEIPEIVYPLAKDPKAEFSEYIFEDVDELRPIFDYNIKHSCVEVIILYCGLIYSIDYIPAQKGNYSLVGSDPKDKEIQYAYLSKKEKVPFIEVSKGDEVFIQKLDGYDFQVIGDNKKDGSSIHLDHEDIFRFQKGDLEIFLRRTDSPPKVKHAPVFSRDKEFRKYLLIMFLLVGVFLGGMLSFEVDKELEKEKAPQRLATILYKSKPVVSKNMAIEKTKDAPKKQAQKSQSQQQQKKEPQKKQQTTKNKQKAETSSPKAAQKKQSPPKQASPSRAKKVTQRTQREKSKASSSSASSKQASSRANRKQSKGKVDTYQSADFSSSLSNLMAKGGSAKNVRAAKDTGSQSETGSLGGSESTTIKRAEMSGEVGSLKGSASGKLDTTEGLQGIADKRNVYTAGLPYKTLIVGGMDPDTIRQILIENIPLFRQCYQSALDRSSSAFDGVVKLNFIIGASGHVTRAGVDQYKNLDTNVRRCVVDVLKGIRFPRPRGGGVVEVNQPFNFYPQKAR